MREKESESKEASNLYRPYITCFWIFANAIAKVYFFILFKLQRVKGITFFVMTNEVMVL